VGTVEEPREWNRQQALKATQVSERQLGSWEKVGLVERRDKYFYGHLAELQTLGRLAREKVGPKKIRAIMDSLRARKIGAKSNPLLDVRLEVEYGQPVVRVDGQRIHALTGQALLDFDQARPAVLSMRRSEPAAKQADEARQKQQAELIFQKALEAEQQPGAADEAIALYLQSVEMWPQMAAAWLNMGTLYFNKKKWKQAQDAYRKALEIDENYALAHFNMGNIQEELGQLKEAWKHYTIAIHLDANYADAHYNLALLLQNLGHNMEAMGHWKAYLKLDSSSTWAGMARQQMERLRDRTLIQGLKGVV
jgi:tetratricopeptide (TPR) repeat protein